MGAIDTKANAVRDPRATSHALKRRGDGNFTTSKAGTNRKAKASSNNQTTADATLNRRAFA